MRIDRSLEESVKAELTKFYKNVFWISSAVFLIKQQNVLRIPRLGFLTKIDFKTSPHLTLIIFISRIKKNSCNLIINQGINLVCHILRSNQILSS